MPEYAYCERVTAGSNTSWHIRELTSRGHRYGGRADSLSLCGARVAWDVKCDVSSEPTDRDCKWCREAFNLRKRDERRDDDA